MRIFDIVDIWIVLKDYFTHIIYIVIDILISCVCVCVCLRVQTFYRVVKHKKLELFLI